METTLLEHYMCRCIQLAKLGLNGVMPNPNVGCVIVHQDRIIGEGYHKAYGMAHAEVEAINSIRQEDRSKIADSVLFVNLEPCAHTGKTPPCADRIVKEGFRHVVVGCLDPNPKVAGKGIQKLKEAGIEVTLPVLEEECLYLNRKFFYYQTKCVPYVTLKWAQTQDGFIDRIRLSHQEEPEQITGITEHVLVHQLRAQHQAILVGTNTYNLDQPKLTTRLVPGKDPIRVAIDCNKHCQAGNIDICFDKSNDLHQLLEFLGEQNIISLFVEGGNALLQSFIEADLWNQAYVFTSPKRLYGGVPAPSLSNEVYLNAQFLTVGESSLSIINR